MKIDMLVFGEDWAAHPSSTQHLISQYRASQQILWACVVLNLITTT